MQAWKKATAAGAFCPTMPSFAVQSSELPIQGFAIDAEQRSCFGFVSPHRRQDRADILVLQFLKSHAARHRRFEIHRGQILTSNFRRQIRALDPIVTAQDQRSLDRVL